MEKTLQSKMIYDGRRLRLYRDEVELPDGRHTFREVVSHPGAVAVVPVTEEGDVFLVKQFRYAIRSELYEIPAGIIEKGESPEQCAVRELREEAGLNAGKMEKLGQFYTSPGVMDELMHIYRATELTAPGYKPEEGIEVVKMKLGQAIDKIKTGEIADAKTICGVFWVVRGITQKEAH
ncbi:MAG: NUDIX hydrolase [Candidatus Brocadiales bacterium]|nr:NUDIX hydrolase [Candidatus Bathyanammoxibius sp.]